jgi:2-phospho-L-lactate guanylyltransferase (CobY/MobA/RfbA family)
LAAAKAAGVIAHVIESEALALDLDHPEDLDCLRHRDGALAAQLLGTLATSVEDRRAALAVNER